MNTENTDSDLKVHARHYANELLVRVRPSFQNLLQTRSTCRNNTKKCLGKEYWRVVVADKSTDHDKTHINLSFYHNIYTKENVFFSSERELKKVLSDTLTRAGMDSYRQRPSNFWLVRSEHAHASYSGLLFSPTRVQPIWGGKKGESRDLTPNWWHLRTYNCWANEIVHFLILPQ